MNKRLQETLVSLIFLVIGIFVFVQSNNIKPLMTNELGSGFFPKLVSIVMIILAILKIIMNFYNTTETVIRTKEKKAKGNIKGGIITIILVGVYAFSYRQIGFLLGSVVYLFLQILILAPKSKRNLPLFTLISLVVPVFIYLVFTRLINMPLPKGVFGF